MRSLGVTLFKLTLVGVLIYWLVQSGRLEFKQLRIFIDEPVIFLAAAGLWSIGYLGLGGIRWFVLLRGLDLDVSFLRTLHLQLIGFFFNTAVPGAVGGDIIKAVYVIREQHRQCKTPAMLTILLDRIIGLASLFVLAGLAIAFNFDFFTSSAQLLPIAIFVGLGLLAMVAAAGVVFFPHKENRDPLAKLLAADLPMFKTLAKIYEALRSYRHRPGVLFVALILSCVIQGGGLLFTLMVTRVLTQQSPDLSVFAMVYPVGVMTTAIPLAPGGIGVGHVAFEKLFHLAGLSGGANVFNVTVIVILALNLLGFIPYLVHKTRMPPMSVLESELQSARDTAG